MNIDEAKARVAAQNAELSKLEAEVGRLAQEHGPQVLMAMMCALVEMVCAAQGDVFRVHNKIKLYGGVLMMLREKGIS